jgi:succinyl-CoA synthetase alpha subunit
MILVDDTTRVLVQGITGREATFHARRCIDYGTKVVAGVTPGKGGTMWEDSVPVFESVEQARAATGATTSLIFVPAPYATDAIIEAADAGISLIVCITDLIPTLDEVTWHRYLQGMDVTVVGPNCPGLISPAARCKVGIMPGAIHMAGNVGVISRSGTLTYEVVEQLTSMGIGQSTCIGIGGDPLPGTDFVRALRLFEADPDTSAVVMVGEIGGSMEQDAAAFIGKMTKPVVAFIAGTSAPAGRRMGHAGAIISGQETTANHKTAALRSAGAFVVENPAEIGATTLRVLDERGLRQTSH